MSHFVARLLSPVFACSIVFLCWPIVAHAQTVDSDFNPGANQIVWSMASQADGKIIVGGAFTGLGGATGTTTRNHIGRLNHDGSVDIGFNPGTNSVVQTVAVQADGKILIGGNFTSVGGGTGLTTARNHIARLNSDGSVDLTFDPGANNTVYSLVVQADGKILVGGNFTTLGGGGTGTTARIALGRLNENGSLDSFNPGASKVGGAPIVYSMALQPDGQIVVGGYFQGLGGGTGSTPRNYIGRVDGNGAVDAAFNPGATFYVSALALQADGEILAGGNFTGLGNGDGTGSSRLHIGRLTTEGLVDLGFNPGTESEVHTLGVQVDGKILAGGYFKWMGAAGNFASRSVRNYVGRLNADGSVDATFNPGADNIVEALLIQPDGAVVAGGHFLHVGDGTGLTTARNEIARFPTTAPAVQTLTLTGGGSAASVETWLRSGAGPEVSSVTFEFSFDGSFYAQLGSGVRMTGGWQLTSVNLPTTRTVYLRARGYYGSGFQNGSGSIVELIFIQIPPNRTGDYNGDGNADVAVFSPASGTWSILNSGGSSTPETFSLGANGDIPVPGDYDGDGRTDAAVYRPSTGTWYVRNSSSPSTPTTLTFGESGDIPVPGDYDGDGRTHFALYRPNTGTWLIRGVSGDVVSVTFGVSTDIPVQGDYDGDGKADIAVYRPSNGVWYILQSSDSTLVSHVWGTTTDVPVQGDYDGDGKTDLAVYRASSGTWYIQKSSDLTNIVQLWGNANMVPAPADYNGDGKTDIAVFGAGTWAIPNPDFTAFVTYSLGSPGDIPVSTPFNVALQPKQTLTVTKIGTGIGTLTSSPAGISCGATCSASYPSGQVVAMAATPAPGSIFSGWSGDADCVDGSVTMSDLRSCVARFERTHNDFDSDGMSDIVWQNSDGRSAIWLMNGLGAVTGGGLLGPGTGWSVQQIGDFNGDGKSDIVWQKPDGSSAIWLMDGLSVINGSSLLDPGTGWSVKQIGDFNGDGKSDIVWQKPDGSAAIWLMDGLSVITGGGLLGPGTGWSVQQIGDFNGDGKSDIVWQKPDGSAAIWLMDGLSVLTGGGLLGPATGWSVKLIGDFNGDGKSDIAWQNSDGSSAVWLMNGLSVFAGGGLLGPATGWSVKLIGDFNGDGKSDIAWQNSNGSSAAWIMDGLGVLAGGGLLGPGTAWSVHQIGDFNADGKSDIVWRNSDGSSAIWLMNGLSAISGGGLLGPGTGWTPAP